MGLSSPSRSLPKVLILAWSSAFGIISALPMPIGIAHARGGGDGGGGGGAASGPASDRDALSDAFGSARGAGRAATAPGRGSADARAEDQVAAQQALANALTITARTLAEAAAFSGSELRIRRWASRSDDRG